jgi:hypothetical protein
MNAYKYVNAVSVTVNQYFSNDKIKADAIYVGGAGNLVVELLSGQSVTFNSVPAGTIIPVQCVRVLNTSTATNLVALFC